MHVAEFCYHALHAGSSSEGSSGSDSDSEDSEDSSDDEGSASAQPDKGERRGSGDGTSAAPKKRKRAKGTSKEERRSNSKKRKTYFPVIKASERCGKCHTCLNPQMKKACLTRRAEMAKAGLAKNGKLPSSATPSRSASPEPTSSTKAKPAPASNPNEKYVELLRPLVNTAGGLASTDTIPKFLNTLSQFGPSSRMLPCLVIQQSSDAVLAALTKAGILSTMAAWMEEVLQQQQLDQQQCGVLEVILEALKKLPVDQAVLRSTGIGKLVNGLRARKDLPTSLIGLASTVKDTWLQCVRSRWVLATRMRRAGLHIFCKY
jgi:hypothetical protein